MDGRLDLPASPRPRSGDRPRRPPAQAVSLSSALARGSGRDEVSSHARLRSGASRHTRAAVARHEPSGAAAGEGAGDRSEEHTSELQSLMRISYAVFCLKKKKKNKRNKR